MSRRQMYIVAFMIILLAVVIVSAARTPKSAELGKFLGLVVSSSATCTEYPSCDELIYAQEAEACNYSYYCCTDFGYSTPASVSCDPSTTLSCDPAQPPPEDAVLDPPQIPEYAAWQTPGTCRFPNVCGDGVMADTEQCDDGNAINTDACTNTCVLAACGDGFMQVHGADGVVGGDDDEECDNGPDNTDSGPEEEVWCSTSCTLPVCSNGRDDDNDDKIDDEDGICYEPIQYDYIDGAGDYPSSPGDQEAGVMRKFFGRLFPSVITLEPEPIFMPGRSVEGGACEQTGDFDPDLVDGVDEDGNPAPEEEIMQGDPNANQMSCFAAGGIGWSANCDRNCRCANGSSMLNGMCVPTNCQAPFNNGECDAAETPACGGNEYCGEGVLTVYRACRVWVDCTTFCQELDLGIQCTENGTGGDTSGGGASSAPSSIASSAQSSAPSSAAVSSIVSSIASSTVSTASSVTSSLSSAITQCITDADCTPTCSTCDHIPGFGCGKKCYGVRCTAGQCSTTTQDYIFCASNACIATASSSVSSSRSSVSSSRSSLSSSRSSLRVVVVSSSAASSKHSSSQSSSVSSVRCITDENCSDDQFCLGNKCIDHSSSSVSTAASSSRTSVVAINNSSSRISSSAVSSVIRTASTCTLNECATGGLEFCVSQGFDRCNQIAAFPCIACANAASSQRSSVSSIPRIAQSCTMNECATGGSEFCATQGFDTCTQLGTPPCITCSNTAVSSAANVCTSDVQCPTNLCIDGQCQDCTYDEQCSTNYCDRGRCSVCTQDTQCALDRCLPGGTCAECLDNSQCQQGERCVGNFCLNDDRIAMLPRFCGNGRIDAGESCDSGSGNADVPNALCRTDCQPARCGDGILDMPLEMCDDGNSAGNDGCSAQCQIERMAPQTLPGTVVEVPYTPTQSSSSVMSVASTPTPPANADTGPATVAIMAAGAAAGYAFLRRRKA